MTLDKLPLIEQIPGPDAIKSRMAQLVREQQLLRSLLKLSHRKAEALDRERQQSQQGGPTHAA